MVTKGERGRDKSKKKKKEIGRKMTIIGRKCHMRKCGPILSSLLVYHWSITADTLAKSYFKRKSEVDDDSLFLFSIYFHTFF